MDTCSLHPRLSSPVIALVLLLCSLSTSADQSGEALSEGYRLLNEGETEQAYDLLWEAVLSAPGDMDANYLLGRAAMSLKLYENAVAAYERILVADPDQAKARLYLGIANYALGSFTAAKQELELLLSAEPPQAIRQKANRYLERIKGRKQESRFRARLSVGLVYNTNVGNTATPQDDWGAMVGLGMIHDWDPGSYGGFGWGTTALLYNIVHSDVSDYDLNYLAVDSGPEYLRPKVYRIAFPFSYETTRYGSDDYLNSFGIKPRITFFHSPNFTTRLSAAWRYQDFDGRDGRDGTLASLEVMPRLFWGNEQYMLQWRLGYEWKAARDNINAFLSPGTEVLLRVGADRNMQGRFSLEYRNPRYDELNPSDTEIREDDYLKAAAKFYLPAPWRDSRSVVTVDYKRNHSNIDVYDTTRKRVMFSLEKEF